MVEKKKRGKKERRQGYGFLPDFERDVVYLACTLPRFYGRVAALLDPAMLGQEACTIALRAAKAVAKDTGRGPSTAKVIIQRIRRWVEEGEMTTEQMESVLYLFDRVEDEGGVSTEEEVTEEIIPILRKLMNKAAGQQVLKGGAGGDLSAVKALIEQAENVGKVDVTPGSLLSRDAFAEIAALKYGERLATGIAELDLILGGGIPKGQYWLFAGSYGTGKSMVLTQIAAESIWNNQAVAYATVGEVGESLQKARLLANLTHCPINDITNGKYEEAIAKYEQIADNLGPFACRYFESGSSVQDIREWVKSLEDSLGRAVEVVLIDYIDELHDMRAKNEYIAHKFIGNALHDWAQNDKVWVVSATQARRKEDKRKKKRLDGDDAADSMNKPRKCDGMITINPEKDEEGMVTEVAFFITKFRTGQAYLVTDLLPVDFERGRICAITRDRKPLALIKGGKK